MKVILIQEVENLGPAGKTVEVSDGYGRNYLIPRKLAVLATPSAIKHYEILRKKAEQKLAKEHDQLKALAEKIQAMEIAIKVEAGESGKLYGAVTSADIAEAIRAKAGIEIDRRKIGLDEPIKTVGDYEIPIKFLSGIEAKLKLRVEAQ